MIVQVDIQTIRKSQFGFYRIMVGPFPGDTGVTAGLSSYWMYNGAWHWRSAPNLNPPRPWCL